MDTLSTISKFHNIDTLLNQVEINNREYDYELNDLIEKENTRLKNTIQLNAAENIASKEVLFPLLSNFSSKTAEGTPGKRYHSGCEVVDEMETLAENRLKKLFNSEQVWVQPLSGSLANLIVIQSIMEDYLPNPSAARILAMGLDQGGHLSHCSKFNISGKIFRNTRFYSVDKNTFLLDYDRIQEMAEEYKPHLIICGASSYPREINFKRFGEIADACNAILLSDISHIFGLAATGVHQNPFEHSSFITSSTYKAGGPHGGLIIAGKKSTAAQRAKISKYVFPVIQSTPDFGSIASKAAFFKEMASLQYHETQKCIVQNSRALARFLNLLGYSILTGGTDNHMVLINVKKTHNISGKDASEKLAHCGIYANKNLIPFDTQSSVNCSGVRFGTNTVTRIGMREPEMEEIALIIDQVLRIELTDENVRVIRDKVKTLVNKFSLINKKYY
jgi:glycine hydroxymethyltransferase